MRRSYEHKKNINKDKNIPGEEGTKKIIYFTGRQVVCIVQFVVFSLLVPCHFYNGHTHTHMTDGWYKMNSYYYLHDKSKIFEIIYVIVLK